MGGSLYVLNLQDDLQEKEYSSTTRVCRENAIRHRGLYLEGLPLTLDYQSILEYSQNGMEELGMQQYSEATLDIQQKSKEDQGG